MTSTAQADSDWPVRSVQVHYLAAVRAGESATPAIPRVPGEHRAGAHALPFHEQRQLGRAEALRLAGPPTETISANLSLDLIDQMERGDAGPLGVVEEGVLRYRVTGNLFFASADVFAAAFEHHGQADRQQGQGELVTVVAHK